MITSAIIFLHGLGDTSRGWSFLEQMMGGALPNTTFVFPNAPTAPVSCNQGYPSTSWMDIARIPLDEDEPENPDGLSENVATLHTIIQSTMKQHNLPPEKIIVGGFSQGGAMALLGGGSFRSETENRGVGGVVCLSGWLSGDKKKNVANWASSAMDSTPLFLGHGEVDQVVLTKLGRIAFENIRTARKGCSGDVQSVERYYPGEGHGACDAELRDLAAFFKAVVEK